MAARASDRNTTARRPPRQPTLRVAMLAYPGVQMLDVMGPLEVFARTSRWLRDHGKRSEDAYSVEIIGLVPGPLRASSGLQIYADRGFAAVGGGIDTLLIAGGVGSDRYCADPPIVQWIRRQAGLVRRLASVCTGAFFLAEAGLLKGLRATTHWGSCEDLARRYPDVTSVRVETARRLLEESTEDLETICALSGLGTVESMRRAFLRTIGIPPNQYRQRFHRQHRRRS